MADGWIKLHRKLQENRLWSIKPFSPGQAWVDLLLSATYDGNKFWKRGINIELQPGQVGVSIKGLSENWGWSQQRVRRWLNILKNEDQIEYQISNVTTIITILNYSEYQGINGETKTKPYTKRRPNLIPNEDNQEIYKKVKKEKNTTPIAIRKKNFLAEIESFKAENKDKYSDAMYEVFISYWTEETHGGLKMKFEIEKTWGMSRRLATWARNDFEGYHAEHLKKQAAAKKEQEDRSETSLLDCDTCHEETKFVWVPDKLYWLCTKCGVQTEEPMGRDQGIASIIDNSLKEAEKRRAESQQSDGAV